MRILKCIPILALGLALFVGAGTIASKLHIPPLPVEILGVLLFATGFGLLVVLLIRFLLACARGFLGAPAEVRRLNAEIEELRTAHSLEIEGLQKRHLADLPKRGRQLGSVWLTKNGPSGDSAFSQRDDPVYGQLALHKKLLPILCLPLLQRLNYVRQLSFAYLTFPSASHTRLSHVLGVAKNAQEAIRKVLTRGVAYRSRGKDRATGLIRLSSDLVQLDIRPDQLERVLIKAQICGLLHDVGHGPFGHALDKLLSYHDQIERTDPPDTIYSIKYITTYLSAAIREAGFEPDEIASILDRQRRDELSGFDVFIADLIASSFDVDRMDYLIRDAHMTGLEMGYVNTEALLEQMYLVEEAGDFKLVFGPAALVHMEDLAQAHHNMYVNCYEHPRKVATERLLIRAAASLLGSGLRTNELMLLSDDQLLTLLSDFLDPETTYGKCLLGLRENPHFVQVRSYHLSEWSDHENQMVRNPKLSLSLVSWYQERTKGKGYLKRVYIELPESWEKQICRRVGLDEKDWWKVIISVPAYEVRLQQESGALVITQRPEGLFLVDFYEASPILRNLLKILMPEREALRLFVTEDLVADLTKFGNAADEIFIQQPPSGAIVSPPPPQA